MASLDTRQSTGLVAAAALALTSFTSTHAQSPLTQPTQPEVTTTVAAPSLQGAIAAVNSMVVEQGFHTFEVRPYKNENSPKVQALFDRWKAYSEAVRGGTLEGAAPGAIAEAQRSFMEWVTTELKRENITPVSVSVKALERYPGLAEEVTVLNAGMQALLLRYGVAALENRQQIVQDPENSDRYRFITHPPARLYAVTEVNPEAWTALFPKLAQEGVTLARVQHLAGTPYRRDANGQLADAGSFQKLGIAFVDVTAVAALSETLKTAKDGVIRDFIPYVATAPKAILEKLAAGELPANVANDLITRLKEGGFALDSLVALAGTERGTTAFNWNAVTGHRVVEYIAHEGEHALDNSPKNPREQAIGRVRLGAVNSLPADRLEAEALAEMGVRVESMRRSLVYPIQLMAEQRARFSSFGDNYFGRGAKQAQAEIFDAIVAEVKADPKRWGVQIFDGELKVGDVTLTVDEQVMAQFHRPFATSDSANAMADAVKARLRIVERKEALAAKYSGKE